MFSKRPSEAGGRVAMSLDHFQELPIIGIIRGIKPRHLQPAIEAAIAGGLRTIEITMNTPGAGALIREAVRLFSDKAWIGAGTVLDKGSLAEALKAGAGYIVAPHTNCEVIAICREKNIPVFPGALTPTEIHSAWTAGATMVKVFPVSSMGGVSYIKELRGPFNNIKLLACGGVTLENLSEYFVAGADAIAIGSPIFRKDWIESGNYELVQAAADKFIKLVNSR
jgi:2-dehydro-3-deoxyphosphogluconate aldolase/(4S)-4-hydroxy-2-oxoglutarate aldolase